MDAQTDAQAFTVAIIAGGKSTRMGTDKAFVQLAGKPLIEHVIESVAGLGQVATVLITNRSEAYAHLGLPIFNDVIPEAGSLGGIYTAIHHSPTPFTQVIACDTPFVRPALLAHMLTLRSGVEVVVPRVAGYPQGLHGLYAKGCLDPIRERIDAKRLNVIGFYPQVRVRYLDEADYAPFDPSGVSFFNINTPAQLAQAERVAAGDAYLPAGDDS
jgi:molybdopterin-guanine dinucleotide biosynthesis protein A